MLKIYYWHKKQHQELVNYIKDNYFEIYEEIYKTSKDVILDCIMNDNQDELLKVANKLLIPKRLAEKLNGDMRFYEFNKQAINEAIDNDRTWKTCQKSWMFLFKSKFN